MQDKFFHFVCLEPLGSVDSSRVTLTGTSSLVAFNANRPVVRAKRTEAGERKLFTSWKLRLLPSRRILHAMMLLEDIAITAVAMMLLVYICKAQINSRT
jgi:hypothetical protein